MAILPFGFPFGVIGEVTDVWVIDATVIPGFIGLEFSDNGPPIAYGGYGRFCYSFTRGPVTAYTPWVTVDVLPLVVPRPDFDPSVTTDIVLHNRPGVTLVATPATI